MSGPALSADELTELEAAVRHALVTHDDGALEVVGYGEITTVVEWTAGGEPVACKRLPGLADAAAFETYRSGVERYIARLATTGIEVPDTVVQHVTAADGRVTAYCVQAVLPPSSVVPRVMHERGQDEAVGIFGQIVARAEATVHGVDKDKVHFHEVGAVDSIIDIVGAALGVQGLGIEKIVCSPLPLSRGFVNTAHGTIPTPAPATLEILKGVPIQSSDAAIELVTPTGAAIVRTLASAFGSYPSFIPMKRQS